MGNKDKTSKVGHSIIAQIILGNTTIKQPWEKTNCYTIDYKKNFTQACFKIWELSSVRWIQIHFTKMLIIKYSNQYLPKPGRRYITHHTNLLNLISELFSIS